MDKDSAFMKRLLATFKAEAAEHIQAISAGLIELEKAPSAGEQARVVERVFREAHSMKGAARSVGLADMESVCQAFENVAAALKRGELSVGRALLDLLHQCVNVLGDLLSAIGTEGHAPDKTQVRDLITRLNDASRDAGSGSGEKRTRSGLGQSPAAETPFPALASGAADSMRISKSKLDSLLLQGEGFLSIKQSGAQQAAELRAIIAAVSALKKEWTGIRPELRAREGGRKTNGTAARKNGGGKKILAFLASQEDRIAKLEHDLTVLGKFTERELRSTGVMVDGFLDDLKTISMLPFSSLLEMLPKVVRDLARDQDKEVLFTAAGGETEIDKRILDELREPLIHLVRNCVDHGIEKPAQRAAQKKPATGTITVNVALQEGRAVEVTVSDDGRGVNVEKIRDAAMKQGALTREEAEGLDERQALQLAFRSGVTTSPIITDISGRGLGLAIVRERVEKLGGAVFCESEGGRGAAVRMVLPITLATFRGVVVRSGDQLFVIPTVGLDRTVRIGKDDIRTVENRETITLDKRTVPFVSLGSVLELSRSVTKAGASGHVHAAVLGTGGHRIAFGVDEVLSEQEVLVKGLGSQLVRVRNVSGATVLGSGKVVPILHVPDLMRSAVKASSAVSAPAPEAAEAARRAVLVVEDSITSRTLLKNILESSGYDVRTAVDGADAFAALKTADFDLVVSDVDMPRMNGFELTAKIRSDRKLADLPVILVTALDSREDRERGVDVGANAYIVKSSFDKSNLLEAIKRLI